MVEFIELDNNSYLLKLSYNDNWYSTIIYPSQFNSILNISNIKDLLSNKFPNSVIDIDYILEQPDKLTVKINCTFTIINTNIYECHEFLMRKDYTSLENYVVAEKNYQNVLIKKNSYYLGLEIVLSCSFINNKVISGFNLAVIYGKNKNYIGFNFNGEVKKINDKNYANFEWNDEKIRSYIPDKFIENILIYIKNNIYKNDIFLYKINQAANNISCEKINDIIPHNIIFPHILTIISKIASVDYMDYETYTCNTNNNPHKYNIIVDITRISNKKYEILNFDEITQFQTDCKLIPSIKGLVEIYN